MPGSLSVDPRVDLGPGIFTPPEETPGISTVGHSEACYKTLWAFFTTSECKSRAELITEQSVQIINNNISASFNHTLQDAQMIADVCVQSSVKNIPKTS